MESDTKIFSVGEMADGAEVRAMTAKAALEELSALVVSGALDVSKPTGADTYATTTGGIMGHMEAVIEALDAIAHTCAAPAPIEPRPRPVAFDLDLIDRANESMHELQLLSDYACTCANGRAATDAERGAYDAISMMATRAADALGQMVRAAHELNGKG